MGKCSDFPSLTPKSAIYTPMRDGKHPRQFYLGVPPPPRYDQHIKVVGNKRKLPDLVI